MDCKIPHIDIAETQRSRMIIFKYSYLLWYEHQDSSTRFHAWVRYNLNI
jgi:hypothetical protein